MKKIGTTIALSILLFSCKQETKIEQTKNYSQIYDSKELLELRNSITDSVEKLKFYQHLYQVTVFEDLKNYKSETNLDLMDEERNKEFLSLKNNPDNVLIDISKVVVSEYTPNIELKDFNSNDGINLYKPKEIIKRLDSIFMTKKYDLGSVLHEAFVGTLAYGTYVSSFKNNIVTIERQFGTGASMAYQYVLIENNNAKNLKEVYDYLNKPEYQKLETEIKRIAKTYRNTSTRSGTEIKQLTNNNYNISFRGELEEDAGCCPSLEINYETVDFKSIIPNSIKVKVNK
ncbi:hypothetical protein ABF176_002545 [Flavobacterium psychrophilum]